MEEVELGRPDALRIATHLWRVMKAQGYGTIVSVARAFGLAEGSLRRRRDREGFRVHQVCAILRFLDYPVSAFFAEAVGDGPTTAGDRFLASGSDLIARGIIEVPEMALPTRLDVLADVELEALDRLRFEDPKRAAEQGRRLALLAASDGRQGDAAACAGRWGSALRATEQWHQAHTVVCWAINHAPEGPILADCWLRAASVTSDYGEFADAAELAQVAMLVFVEIGDDIGMGKALLLRGINLRRSGLYDHAIRCLGSALARLPSCERTLHFACHLTIGLACVGIGDIEAAQHHASQAEILAPRTGLVRLRWLRARVSDALDDHEQAIALYRHIAEELSGSPADAALVGVELARILLKQGQAKEAIEVARGLGTLAMPWRANRQVSAAIRDLWRSISVGELNLRVLARIDIRIRSARNRRTAPLRPRSVP